MKPVCRLLLAFSFLACPPLALSGNDSPPPVPFSDGIEGGFNDCFCISRDGKLLALNDWAIWDIASRKRLKYGTVSGAHGIAFSPDGKLFATAGNYAELYVFHTKTGKVYWDLRRNGHNTVVSHVTFANDGKHMVSTSDNGMLRVWDIKKKKAVALYCFPSTGGSYRNEYKEYLRAWKTIEGNKPVDGVKAFVEFKQKIKILHGIALSPDSKHVAVSIGTAELWILDLLSGKVVKTLKTKQESTCSVCYSRDGKLLAIGGGGGFDDNGWKGTIEIWDVAKAKRVIAMKGHCHTALHLAFSPDNKLLASGGTVDGVRVWDTKTGKQKYALHKQINKDESSRNVGVAFLPNGKALLTLPHEKNAPVHFWEPATGKRIPQPAKAGAKPR